MLPWIISEISLRYGLQRRHPLPGAVARRPVPEVAAAGHAEELRDDGSPAEARVLLVQPPQQLLQLLPRDPDLHLLHRRRRRRFPIAVVLVARKLLHRRRALLAAMHGAPPAPAPVAVEAVAHLSGSPKFGRKLGRLDRPLLFRWGGNYCQGDRAGGFL